MIRPRPVTTAPSDLATTLSRLTLFQGAVQHADDKARTVVAIQTMLTAMVAAQLTFLADPHPTGGTKVAQLAILVVFASGYFQSSCHLLRAIVPRTAPPQGHNQFAFPSVAMSGPSPARSSPREQSAQAHELGRLLAHLAMVKHRHVRRALYGTYGLFASALASLVLTVFS
jgi:hypothetical protein